MIGVYGGTFDPVHFGHLRSALEVLQDFGLSQIRFIPCGQPPHRQPAHASAVQRLVMLQLAIDGVTEFFCDAREIQRPGKSFMIDTLESLRIDLPRENFCLLLGMDAFASFHTWHNWREIPRLCNLLVMHRPDFDPSLVIQDEELKRRIIDMRVADKAEFLASAAGKLMFYPVTQLNISSSSIRESIRQRCSIRYLLPVPVMEFIERDSIYH